MKAIFTVMNIARAVVKIRPNFHIFTVIYSSLHRFIWNQHNDQLPVGLLAQLVECCMGITEFMGSNPVQA